VVVPPPADVEPSALHALCCAAVEHAYTGGVPAALPAASLLPLWCVARHLQMDALQAFCVRRLGPALAADLALLSATAGVTMRHRCDALLQAVAAALLAHAPRVCDASVAAALDAAAPGGDDALADALAAVIRDALLARREEEAARREDGRGAAAG
jgi:hypothetical protein